MGVRKRAVLTLLSRGCQGALAGMRRVDGRVMGVTEGVGGCLHQNICLIGGRGKRKGQCFRGEVVIMWSDESWQASPD